MAVTCAIAVSMLAPGWKKTFTTAMPFSDCDSMCSMSSTVVVSERSVRLMMRLLISSALSPV